MAESYVAIQVVMMPRDTNPHGTIFGGLVHEAFVDSHVAARFLGCLLGTLVQETYATHPEIRAACDRGMSRHIAELTRDIEAAKQRYAPKARWSAESVGYFIQSTLQGSFIFAKAKQSPEVVRENLEHLRRYLTSLFATRQAAARVDKH